MPFVYTPLWEMLARKNLSKTEFREKVGISTSTLAKLSSNQPVSMDIIAKICERMGCSMDNVVCYQSELDLFLHSLQGKIDSCRATVYIDRWPQCRFTLNNQQKKKFFELERTHEITEITKRCELAANEEVRPNAGIIGTTNIQFIAPTSELVIDGSLAVTKKFMTYFLNLK